MNQSLNDATWIDEYLDWTAPVAGAPRAAGAESDQESDADAGSPSVTAYLEWLDILRTVNPAAAVELRKESDVDRLRETTLLAALQAESDCMHMLRQAPLDTGRTNPHTIRLAAQALKLAKRLLEDERGAWRALGAMRGAQTRSEQYSFRSTSWPNALEGVAADVHALTRKVLALRARQRHH